MMLLKPEMCPYCGEKRLEELQPTEVVIDDMLWTIYHYECQFCSEVFDKIVPEGEMKYDIFSEGFDAETDEDDGEKRFNN
ncbi:hypothetical protein Dacet_1740 [Denitrovibrio acetiphilus DSM 12809]|uniref:Uncharacterized protein n=1 Tax=Denitrovibrio acetiphilus (strain DSM 12809 / NBRC 114555 / N2460) TaxID=522772 RepID=D4H0J1_DENA2|nr:hypothetical protein [Denitrovibrio acetiphilus]ADD68504.1 hypothetical protein Dacet_1740 [Denitrovibrio acetiphilus DSM 12809]